MGLTRGNVFPSKYLGKEDVTTPIRATIGSVYLDQIQGEHGMENKAVISFTDVGIKAMIVNSTNWDALEASYGADTDGWIGKPVEVYVDPGVMFGGRRVGGVRVRVPAGPAPAPALPMLTWPEAIAAAGQAGISKDDLVAALKAKGFTGYVAARDTVTERAMIADKTAQPAAFDADVPPEGDIPF